MATKNYPISINKTGSTYTLTTQFASDFFSSRYTGRDSIGLSFNLTGVGTQNNSFSIPYSIYGITAIGTKTLLKQNFIEVETYTGQQYSLYVDYNFNGYTNYECVINMTGMPTVQSTSFYLTYPNGTHTRITDYNFDTGNVNVDNDITYKLTRENSIELFAPYVKVVRANGESTNCTYDNSTKKFIVPSGFLKATTETLSVSLCEPIFANDDFILHNNVITKTFDFFTLSYPTITGLEPDGVNQNRDNAITVSWMANNQTNFKLEVLQNSIVLKTYTGTTLQELVIPSKTIPTGIIALRLTTWNINSNYTTTDTKEVSFLAYGTPNTPVQDGSTLYSTSKPTLTWNSDDQTGYHITIEDTNGNIIETKQENNTNKSYTLVNALSNNTNYIVRLRIKNVYDLWSVNSLKTIRISFTELIAPTLNLYLDSNNAVINITTPTNVQFDYNEIYRKSEFDNTYTRICTNIPKNFAYVDKTLAANTIYYYKIRSVGKDGGIVESEVKNISVSVAHYNFYKVEDFDQNITLIGDPKSSYNKIRNTSYAVFAGCRKPTLETGLENYYEGSFSFFVDIEQYKQFIKLLENSTILLFKDYMGKKAYGFIHGSIEEEYVEYVNAYNISFDFVEVDFDETDMYIHERIMKVVYLDGTYKLDGSITLSGVVEDE